METADSETFVYEGLGELRQGQILFSYRLLEPVPYEMSPNKTSFLAEPATELPTRIKGSKIEWGTQYLMKFFNPPRNATESTQLNFIYAGRDLQKQFNWEVEQLAKSNHSNIAKVVDYGVSSPIDGSEREELFYFVEEFVNGRDLKRIIDTAAGYRQYPAKGETPGALVENGIADESGMLSIDFIVSMMYDIVKGINHLHTRNIAHGDIRPANVIISNVFPRFETDDTRPLAVLTDLGSANELGNTKYYQLGSMVYRAPEVVRALRATPEGKIPSVGTKTPADKWSLGVTLYQLLTGDFPFGMDVSDWSGYSQDEFIEARDELMERIEKERLVAPSTITGTRRYENLARPKIAAHEMDDLVRNLLQRDSSKRIRIDTLLKKLQGMKRKYYNGNRS